MQRKPFSPERLFHIRRLRKARRLFRQVPLFAFYLMQREYGNYTYLEFLDDLRIRHKKMGRPKKSPLARYGRYNRMEQLMRIYDDTKDIQTALDALKLRRHMSHPYRVLLKITGVSLEFTLSPLIPIDAIEQLVDSIRKCRTEAEAYDMVQRCRNAYHLN